MNKCSYNKSIAVFISREQCTRFRPRAPEADIHSLPIPEDSTRMIMSLNRAASN